MRLTLITVNYNTAERVMELMKSLAAQSDSDFDTIVIDNNSRDQSTLARYLAGADRVAYVSSADNLGFAGACNIGLEKCFSKDTPADFGLLINSDTLVGPDFIATLKKQLIGLTGLVGVPIEEHGRLVTAGHVQWLRATLSHRTDRPDDTSYIIGAGLVISRQAYQTLGGLDENYFLYFEDADYSVLARRKGVGINFLTEPTIYHEPSSATTKLGVPLLLRYHYRNALYFNHKNGPSWVRFLLWFWSAGILLKQGIKMVLHRESDSARAIARGVFDFYRGRTGHINFPL